MTHEYIPLDTWERDRQIKKAKLTAKQGGYSVIIHAHKYSENCNANCEVIA